MVESTTRKRLSKNWRGLSRFISREALKAQPDAQKITLQTLQGRYPDGILHRRHRIVLEAPEWEPVLEGPGGQ